MAAMDFTQAHVLGTYAVVERGHGGRGVAVGLGTITFDGAGGLSGRLRRNVPGPRIGEREVLEREGPGTYTITPQGLISASLGGDEDTLRLAVRAVAAGPGGGPRVEELAMVGRDLDEASGCLMTGTATRWPDNAAFELASMQGLYVGAALGDGGQSPAAGFGFVRYDGRGGFHEVNTANIQADTAMTRRFIDGRDEGVYTIEADGRGTVAGGGVQFIVTRASVGGEMTRVEAYAFVVQGVVPATGALFTGTVQRVSD